MAQTKEWKIASFTDPGTVYTVTQNASPGRPWMCDCKGWIFARRDPSTGYKKNCKHVRATISAMGGTVTAVQTDHPAGARVKVDGEDLRVTTARKTPKLV